MGLRRVQSRTKSGYHRTDRTERAALAATPVGQPARSTSTLNYGPWFVRGLPFLTGETMAGGLVPIETAPTGLLQLEECEV